jgi:hypothetical protein
MATKPQPWSGRFRAPVAERVKRFTASVDFDRRLAQHDIAGSVAHARMLAAARIISKADLHAIERGLARIRREIRSGRFAWSLDAEDVHLNIERRLTALAGEAGKRLHTARSRNDQVATDLRLWLRDEIDAIDQRLVALLRALITQAERHAALVMPGFTHLQVAQPVTFGHHLLAYVAMLERDRARARLSGNRGELTRCRVGPRFRDRILRLRRARHGASVAAGGRAGALVEPALRLRAAAGKLLHRLLHHAAEEKPGRARAGAWQERPGDRQPGRAAHAHEGAAARL